MALTDQAHAAICEHLSSIDITQSRAIDATCGNGWDTLFLAKLGFETVFAFDVQQQAIMATKLRIEQAHLSNVTTVNQGHQNLTEHCTTDLVCAMFNFGYLPKADKNITTQTDTSLIALGAALEILEPRGIISLLCYPGHSSGREESRAIVKWVQTLGQQWQVKRIDSQAATNSTPFLLLITGSA